MREFNITGTCVKNLHYMANTDSKIQQIISLIERGKYFTINRPRQYGKTTTLSLLRQALDKKYLILSLSFEGVSQDSYNHDKDFIDMLHEKLQEEAELMEDDFLATFIPQMVDLRNFNDLNRFISRLAKASEREIILMIDECDDGSNNDIFLKFLGVLRAKYLKRSENRDTTFKSVILAGVHDIKSLKYKVRDSDTAEFNSPWNIAEDFDVDMSLSLTEIESLLADYLSEHSEMVLDTTVIAEKILYFTNGHPFLVSSLCKMVDENLSGVNKWSIHSLEQMVNDLVLKVNPNFDSLLQNVGNHEDLQNVIRMILVDGVSMPFGNSAPAMRKGLMYGIFRRSRDSKLIIDNPIYEIKLYSYFTEKIKSENKDLLARHPMANYFKNDGSLDLPLMMEKYTQYLKDLSDDKQDKFIENNARLLLSIFIKSIINGTGFMYREPVISDRRRLDVVVTYNHFKYVIELKIWDGPAYYEQAKMQLADYLTRENLAVGYMLIHDFRKVKHQRDYSEDVSVNGKLLKVYFV